MLVHPTGLRWFIVDKLYTAMGCNKVVIIAVIITFLMYTPVAKAKLVVGVDDAINADIIEREATLVKTYVKETDCEGVTVSYTNKI